MELHSLTTDNYLIHYFHNGGQIPHNVVIPLILSCEGRCKRKDDEAPILNLIVRVTKCQFAIKLSSRFGISFESTSHYNLWSWYADCLQNILLRAI